MSARTFQTCFLANFSYKRFDNLLRTFPEIVLNNLKHFENVFNKRSSKTFPKPVSILFQNIFPNPFQLWSQTQTQTGSHSSQYSNHKPNVDSGSEHETVRKPNPRTWSGPETEARRQTAPRTFSVRHSTATCLLPTSDPPLPTAIIQSPTSNFRLSSWYPTVNCQLTNLPTYLPTYLPTPPTHLPA